MVGTGRLLAVAVSWGQGERGCIFATSVAFAQRYRARQAATLGIRPGAPSAATVRLLLGSEVPWAFGDCHNRPHTRQGQIGEGTALKPILRYSAYATVGVALLAQPAWAWHQHQQWQDGGYQPRHHLRYQSGHYVWRQSRHYVWHQPR